jgi:hypothetical protein
VITASSSSDQQLQRASRPSQAHMLLQGVGGGGHAWGAWGVAPHGVVAGWARAHTSSAVGPPEMDEGSTHCSTQCSTKCTHCMPEPHQCAHALPSERARTRASIRARTHTRFHQSTPGVYPGSCSCMLIGIPEEGLPDSSAFPCESRRGPPESVKIDDFHTFPKKKRSARRLSRSHPPQRVLGVRGLGV